MQTFWEWASLRLRGTGALHKLLIYQKGKAMPKKVTLKDIAEKSGVSVSTVFRVLNNKDTEYISKETIENITNLAISMGYVKKNFDKL